MFSSAYRSFVVAALALAGLASGAYVELVGRSGVSAQMMYLQSNGQVIILDKVENNPAKASNGFPASAVAYNYRSNTFRTLDVRSNPFCAGGATLGDGRWIVVGGNKAVGPGGVDATPGAAPYGSYSGGRKLRFMAPCSGEDCKFYEEGRLGAERWYATVEPMKDGHVMILGGMRDGGFVPSQNSNEPSYEFYPSVGAPTQMDILRRSVPLSLYPITYLLSDGRVFVQANKQVILWNTDTLVETRLPAAPIPINYPSSGGNAMLMMRPSNNFRQTLIQCGGNSLGSAAAWGNEGGPKVAVATKAASRECWTINPLSSNPTWTRTDDLAEGRSMGTFINLPTGELWFGNGVKKGVAGYTTDPNSPGKPAGFSFGDDPSYNHMIYDPTKPQGNRWRSAGTAKVGRLYHSSAVLLPDSSILIAGSNPNPDFVSNQKWNTEYRVERWYPDFANSPRPSNAGLPSVFSYGGKPFTLNIDNASKAKVVIIRTGFSTHGMQMAQRSLELRSSASGNTLTVAQLPANPALFAPGPALAFVVVDGIPSMGKFVMIGNGRIGAQPVQAESNVGRRADEVDADEEETTAQNLEQRSMAAAEIADILNQKTDVPGETQPEVEKGSHQSLQESVEGILELLGQDKLSHLSGRDVKQVLKRHRIQKRQTDI